MLFIISCVEVFILGHSGFAKPEHSNEKRLTCYTIDLSQKKIAMTKKLIAPLILLALLVISCATNGSYNDGYARPVYIAPGVGLGTIIAVVVSWSRNKSILWAIIHGILGWLYVIYAIFVKAKD